MNRRRAIVGLAALGTSIFLAPARAQTPAKIPRVAVLTYGSPSNSKSRTDAFVKGMRELGYEEGRNVVYEWRSANGQPDLLRELAQELSHSGADVIVSASAVTTRALQQATKSIPIIMTSVDDPVVNGFVHSLAHPDSNVTGLTANVLEQVAKHVELLAKAVPGLSRVAALMNPSSRLYAVYRSRLEASARASRVRLFVVDVTTQREIDRAFEKFASDHIGGVIVMSDGLFYNNRLAITELATRFRLPVIYTHQGYIDAGGLMSYGPNLVYNYFRAAAYVDKILKGAHPADLPIEQPTNHELIVNRVAARSIGLALSSDFLKRANKVIG